MVVRKDDSGVGLEAPLPPSLQGPSSAAVSAIAPSFSSTEVVVPATYYGVFDGHGGSEASTFCSDWLSQYVRQNYLFPHDLAGSMRGAYGAADDDFSRMTNGGEDGLRVGTTALMAVVIGSSGLVCANAGDSRAVVVRRNGSCVAMSRDHTPGVPGETKRITDLGGRVVYRGRWRVEGTLAVSRSIGDGYLKPYVTCEPDVREYDLGRDDLFLVMCTDGVWDVLDNDFVARFVLRWVGGAEDKGSGVEKRLEQVAAGGISTKTVTTTAAIQSDPAEMKIIARRICEEAR